MARPVRSYNLVFTYPCQLGQGDSIGLNPSVAHALGLPENTGVIWCRTTSMTPEQKEAAGIPPGWHEPYLLDVLSFELAASMLREDPGLLEGRCRCHN